MRHSECKRFFLDNLIDLSFLYIERDLSNNLEGDGGGVSKGKFQLDMKVIS